MTHKKEKRPKYSLGRLKHLLDFRERMSIHTRYFAIEYARAG